MQKPNGPYNPQLLTFTLLLYKVTFWLLTRAQPTVGEFMLPLFHHTRHWQAINQTQFQIFQKGSIIDPIWIKWPFQIDLTISEKPQYINNVTTGASSVSRKVTIAQSDSPWCYPLQDQSYSWSSTQCSNIVSNIMYSDALFRKPDLIFLPSVLSELVDDF